MTGGAYMRACMGSSAAPSISYCLVAATAPPTHASGSCSSRPAAQPAPRQPHRPPAHRPPTTVVAEGPCFLLRRNKLKLKQKKNNPPPPPPPAASQQPATVAPAPRHQEQPPAWRLQQVDRPPPPAKARGRAATRAK